METTKRIIIILIVALFTAGPAISDETELSNTTTASCLLKITSNPSILPLEDHIIEHLLRSSGVAGKAARDVLDEKFDNEFLEVEFLADEVMILSRGLADPLREEEPHMNPEHRIMMEMNPEEAMMREMMGMEEMEARMARSRERRYPGRRMFSESSNIASEQMILLRIAVNIEPVGTAAAEEFLHALIENLEDTIGNAFRDYENRYDDRLKLANEQASEAEEELRRIQEVLKEISGSRILDRDRILDNIAGLRHELQVIEMSRATDDATVEAILHQIEQIRIKSRQQLENDAIINELQRLLEDQKLLITEIKNENAQAEELRDIEEKITRIRIEIAQRHEELNRLTGGERIAFLNSELSDRSIESAQNEAKYRILSEQLEEKEILLDRANDYELHSLKADIAKDNLREAIIWRDRLNRQIRMLRKPLISVLGADI